MRPTPVWCFLYEESADCLFLQKQHGFLKYINIKPFFFKDPLNLEVVRLTQALYHGAYKTPSPRRDGMCHLRALFISTLARLLADVLTLYRWFLSGWLFRLRYLLKARSQRGTLLHVSARALVLCAEQEAGYFYSPSHRRAGQR